MPAKPTLFANIYRGRRVFVTGHTGFKGSWLVYWLKMLGAEVQGYSLPPLTTPNHFDALSLDIESEFSDIRNAKRLSAVLRSFAPDIVFHLAAQPLVRRSYLEPRETFETNVMGTLQLYEAIRESPSVRAVVSITTDKVYANNGNSKGFSEEDRLGGKDPYSASKTAVEILTNSYRHAYFNDSNCLLAIARAGNVIGGGDWSEDRLVPDAVRSVTSGESVVIRSPRAVRPWQHVLEPLSGYLLLGQHLLDGESDKATAFNFGPDLTDHLEVEELLNKMKNVWNRIEYVIDESRADLEESPELRLNASRAREILSWEPVWSSEQAVEKTINWYRAFYEKNELKTDDDLLAYLAEAETKGLPWLECSQSSR